MKPSSLDPSTLRTPLAALPREGTLPAPAPTPRFPSGTLRLVTTTPEAVPSDGMFPLEPARVRWGRRALTIPALLAATLLDLALLPLLLVANAALDLVRRQRLVRCRFHLTIAATLVWHLIGVGALALWWLAGKALRLDQARWRAWHRRLEAWWSHHSIATATGLYGMKHRVEDAERVRPGPVLILARHASIVDTILPTRILGRGRDGLLMRIVKKRELLWDPAVDVISHRLPRAFVRRGSADVQRELQTLRNLCAGMGAGDAAVIFPEGTRFSLRKQAQIVERLRQKDPDAARRAERLRHLLPARAAGSFALLEAQPEMDVVFMVHTGLEGAHRLEDFLAGTLLGKTLQVKFFRVPRHEVPRDLEGFTMWLHDWWERLDRWIDEHRESGVAPSPARPTL